MRPGYTSPMRFYTQTQLSEHIAETREGFLVCVAVPIARTGFMEYAPHEVPIEPGPDGVILIERTEEDVFDPDSMASYEGKPSTINHPAEDVTPANWRGLAVGHAQNIRRGAGEASDLLLADLVITDTDAIRLIRGGLREISCGYDADYEQMAPGHGRQRNIRGNHIALVHRGRCGSRCRINDASEDTMKNKKMSFSDRLVAFFRSPEAQRVLDSLEDEPTAEPEKDAPATDSPENELAALKARLNELEIQVRNMTRTDDDDPEGEHAAEESRQPAEPDVPEKEKTADAALTRTVDADTSTRARILVPGMIVHDSDRTCAVQRTALRSATARDSNIGAVVTSALNGSTLDSCDCVTLDAAFLAASEVARVTNNRATSDGLTRISVRDFGKAVTPADINAMNAKFHNKGV